MGNIQKLCEHEVPPQKQEQWTSSVQNLIIKVFHNRVQLKESPRAPTSIQKKICELLKIEKLQQIWVNSKLWRVKTPFNFCYANDTLSENLPPINNTTIFLYREKGEFIGFFHGVIDDRGERSSLSAIYVYENGDYFVGDAEKLNYGRYVDDKNQYEYVGEWQNHQPNGIGIQKSPKGIYQGPFAQGKKQGKGVFKFYTSPQKKEDQCLVYEGQFVNNEINGEGKLFNQKSGYQYVGQFISGEKHGFGIEKVGHYLYEGHFYQNKKNGNGKLMLYRKDVQFDGQFSNDMPNGKGRMKNKYSEVQGVWRDGKMIALLQQIK